REIRTGGGGAGRERGRVRESRRRRGGGFGGRRGEVLAQRGQMRTGRSGGEFRRLGGGQLGHGRGDGLFRRRRERARRPLHLDREHVGQGLGFRLGDLGLRRPDELRGPVVVARAGDDALLELAGCAQGSRVGSGGGRGPHLRQLLGQVIPDDLLLLRADHLVVEGQRFFGRLRPAEDDESEQGGVNDAGRGEREGPSHRRIA